MHIRFLYCIAMLIVAFFLSLVGFSQMFIGGFYELFNKEITISGYYFIFFLIGLFFDLFKR